MPTSQESRTVVLPVGKRLDFNNAHAFKLSCQKHIDSGAQRFILDFFETGILDSTGMGALFWLYKRLYPSSARPIAIVSPSRPVKMIMELTRTERVFPQFETIQEAHLKFP